MSEGKTKQEVKVFDSKDIEYDLHTLRNSKRVRGMVINKKWVGLDDYNILFLENEQLKKEKTQLEACVNEDVKYCLEKLKKQLRIGDFS